jgi:hypothetical protein
MAMLQKMLLFGAGPPGPSFRRQKTSSKPNQLLKVFWRIAVISELTFNRMDHSVKYPIPWTGGSAGQGLCFGFQI